MQGSRLFACVGEKYKQHQNKKFSPSNVFQLRAQNTFSQIGYRMEDHYLEDHLPSDNIHIHLISDGHGASKMNEYAWVGGYECAKFINHFIRDQLVQHNKNDLQKYLSTDTKKIAPLISKLFGQAQKAFLSEMLKGSSSPVVGEKSRIRDLCQNKIDGHYFSQIYGAGIVYDHGDFVQRQNLFCEGFSDPDSVVVDKRLIQYHDSNVPCYINRKGDIVNYPDYGTTTTLVLVIRHFVFVAHVGDSEVKLFYVKKGAVKKINLTENHSTTNHVEVDRMKLLGSGVNKNYFTASIQGKNKMIMPSRSMGHAYFRHHGISFKPTLFGISINPGDVIIMGSDGLWNHCSDESIEAIVDKAVKQTGKNKNIQDWIGEKIYENIHKLHGHRHDNITFVVLFHNQ
jgi:serine/threonine protein phosphatase PrpC